MEQKQIYKATRLNGFQTPFDKWQIGFYILFVFDVVSFSLFSITSLADIPSASILCTTVYMTFCAFTAGNYY